MDAKKRQEIIDKLKQVFEQYSETVAFAYLFGSSVIDDYKYEGDIDVAVFLQNEYLGRQTGSLKQFIFDLKLRLHADIVRALKRNDIDLVVLNILRNYYLEDDVIRKGVVIYGSEHPYRAEYEVKALHQIIEFKERRKKLMGV